MSEHVFFYENKVKIFAAFQTCHIRHKAAWILMSDSQKINRTKNTLPLRLTTIYTLESKNTH